MTTFSHHHIIVVGCGRVGAELALSLWRRKHRVTIMDSYQRAFERLGTEFQGRTVQGDGMDREALQRAGIEDAHALAAVTSSDSVNIVVARMAQDIFKLDHVVARVYNPHRASVYEKLGLQTIASSSWAAQRIEQIILHPGMRSLHAVGNGEVEIYEIELPEEWEGRTIRDLLPAEGAVPVALTRSGRGLIPTLDTPLSSHDLLHVSATDPAATLLRQRLIQENGA
jgi:trk system potassium uptake protein TrkA